MNFYKRSEATNSNDCYFEITEACKNTFNLKKLKSEKAGFKISDNFFNRHFFIDVSCREYHHSIYRLCIMRNVDPALCNGHA